MGKRARPSRGLPSRRFRRRFPEQKLFRVASVRESIRSECPVLRPCTPPAFPDPILRLTLAAYETFLARRRSAGDVTEVLAFLATTSARTCRTVSLRQMPRIG